jgi:hypothetical protein
MLKVDEGGVDKNLKRMQDKYGKDQLEAMTNKEFYLLYK